MDPNEALLTTSELALGLAGFTGIIGAFHARSGPWIPADAWRLASLLSVSLGVLFLSLIPLALANFPLSSETSWRISSFLMALFTAVLFLAIGLRMRRLDADSKQVLNRGTVALVLIGSLLNAIAQLLNSAGVFVNMTFAVYFAGLVWLLFYACLQFARLLLVRPLTHS
jgi:hypothetical protein